jgi:two-component system sensor histidine kinase MprB
VTFRARVIVTIAAAVAVAVLASCLASYLSTRNALARAVDESLYAAAGAGPNGTRPNEGGTVAGVSYQIILPDCSAVPESELSVDAQACHAANGGTRDFLRTVSTDDGAYRELIHPLPADVIKVPCGNGSTQLCVLGTTSAQLFSVNITGQQHQLHILAFRLWLIALIGVLAAIALGYLAARTALEPLEEVTNRIEEVAETSDIAYRFEPGRTDELGRLRRVFNKLLGSVDDSQKVQRQLVLDASHELRTPLTSLRTNAQVLSRADQLAPGELEQIATDMISQVDELAALISDLAELARGEEIDGTVETLAFDDIVDECVASARLHARARDVSIDATTTTCTIRGRRDRVARAVTNLLSNAIKFAPEHGHVLVTLRDGALSVADDGPGVDPSDVPYVFDRFWRSPRARALPGSGLGLAIVRQVAEESGGSVTVRRSGELGGAEFVLAIPPAADDSVNS